MINVQERRMPATSYATAGSTLLRVLPQRDRVLPVGELENGLNRLPHANRCPDTGTSVVVRPLLLLPFSEFLVLNFVLLLFVNLFDFLQRFYRQTLRTRIQKAALPFTHYIVDLLPVCAFPI